MYPLFCLVLPLISFKKDLFFAHIFTFSPLLIFGHCAAARSKQLNQQGQVTFTSGTLYAIIDGHLVQYMSLNFPPPQEEAFRPGLAR